MVYDNGTGCIWLQVSRAPLPLPIVHPPWMKSEDACGTAVYTGRDLWVKIVSSVHRSQFWCHTPENKVLHSWLQSVHMMESRAGQTRSTIKTLGLDRPEQMLFATPGRKANAGVLEEEYDRPDLKEPWNTGLRWQTGHKELCTLTHLPISYIQAFWLGNIR